MNLAPSHTDSDSACKVCKREVAVGFKSGVKVGETWIVFRECVDCYFAFERERTR